MKDGIVPVAIGFRYFRGGSAIGTCVCIRNEAENIARSSFENEYNISSPTDDERGSCNNLLKYAN